MAETELDPGLSTNAEFPQTPSLPTVRLDLLVGSDAFWTSAANDIERARERLLVQAMTFEADAAGKGVANAISASRAIDRRVLVDDYSLHVINDRIVASPSYLLDRDFRDEVIGTRAMFDALAATGAKVRITNPIGRNPLRYVVRNHKKLIVADDVAYMGGINFSDHNFRWHDLMLRIEGAEAASFLTEDFDATWSGAPVAHARDFEGLSLYGLDGRSNEESFASVFQAIRMARTRIDVISAYPTFPFVDALGEARNRGVAVCLYTPLPNNKPIVRDYLIGAAGRFGIEVRLLPNMTHLKAMLIDDSKLVLGSSNFDFASFLIEEELLAIVVAADLIASFRATVLLPAQEAALPEGAHRVSPRRAWLSRLALRSAEAAVRSMRNAKRGSADWPLQRSAESKRS
jgi:cardiolipin synthase